MQGTAAPIVAFAAHNAKRIASMTTGCVNFRMRAGTAVMSAIGSV